MARDKVFALGSDRQITGFDERAPLICQSPFSMFGHIYN